MLSCFIKLQKDAKSTYCSSIKRYHVSFQPCKEVRFWVQHCACIPTECQAEGMQSNLAGHILDPYSLLRMKPCFLIISWFALRQEERRQESTLRCSNWKSSLDYLHAFDSI